MAGPINVVLDMMWIPSDRCRQSLRDKVAHTYVVKARAHPAGPGLIVYRQYYLMGMSFLFQELEPLAGTVVVLDRADRSSQAPMRPLADATPPPVWWRRGSVRMYVPKHFEEPRVEVVHALIRACPLGALVVSTAHGLVANHVPFEIAPDPAPFGTLRAHIARANPLWREAPPGVEALVIFQGPDAYVSPAWYPTKAETAKVVPTWNYAVAHAHGPVRFIDDRAWLRAFVEGLTDRHETGRPDPWKVTDAPADFVDTMLGAIVGLEIPVARLVGKWKVSQNRPPHDREGVAEALRREGGAAAAAMARLVRGERA